MNKYKVQPSTKEDMRMKETRKMLPGLDPANTLDAGPINYFARSLGIKYFVNTDLNYVWAKGAFNTVTSFEVIEHLYNPLRYLHQCKASLMPYGTLYLTTPVRWMMKGKYHFHEFSHDELEDILNEAGFNDITITRMRAYQLQSIGFRPLLRWIRDVIWGQCWFVRAIV